ncbi:MAG: PilN domain-containing protein [Methylophilaceae bacterium]|nr:PilN domain-containing protein [Methylophilaceae bacterium]
MRIRINLLPYRQERRKERQRQFSLMAIAMVVLGAAIVFSGYTYISAQIDAQNSRNMRLKNAIAQLDRQIKEIEGLKSKIGELKERIQAVESLQHNRSVAVMMLDEIARRVPEAVTLKSIRQKDNVVTLEGVADTNARVATLISNFNNSTLLESPQLVEVKSVILPSPSGQKGLASPTKVSAFIMTVKTKKTAPEAEKKPSGKKGG